MTITLTIIWIVLCGVAMRWRGESNRVDGGWDPSTFKLGVKRLITAAFIASGAWVTYGVYSTSPMVALHSINVLMFVGLGLSLFAGLCQGWGSYMDVGELNRNRDNEIYKSFLDLFWPNADESSGPVFSKAWQRDMTGLTIIGLVTTVPGAVLLSVVVGWSAIIYGLIGFSTGWLAWVARYIWLPIPGVGRGHPSFEVYYGAALATGLAISLTI